MASPKLPDIITGPSAYSGTSPSLGTSSAEEGSFFTAALAAAKVQATFTWHVSRMPAKPISFIPEV